MVDFLIGASHARRTILDDAADTAAREMWARIRNENVCNGAFFPPDLQDDFARVIRWAALLEFPRDSLQKETLLMLEQLRKKCVEHIQCQRSLKTSHEGSNENQPL